MYNIQAAHKLLIVLYNYNTDCQSYSMYIHVYTLIYTDIMQPLNMPSFSRSTHSLPHSLTLSTCSAVVVAGSTDWYMLPSEPPV